MSVSMGKKVSQIVLLFYIFVILVLSLIPLETIPIPYMWSFDKILHIIAYIVLAFLAINTIKKPTIGIIIVIMFSGIVYGGSTELLQGIVGRSVSSYDVIANGIGMVIGSIAAVTATLQVSSKVGKRNTFVWE
jgi:VanZ family protein